MIDTNRTFNPYTYEELVDNYDQAHYQLLFDQRLSPNVTLNATLFRVDGAGYFEQFKEDDELTAYGITPAVINGDTTATSDLIRRRWLDNTLLSANANADIGLGKHRLVLGASYSDYRGKHFGELIWARYAGSTEIGDRYYDNAQVGCERLREAHLCGAPQYRRIRRLAVPERFHRLEMLNAGFVREQQPIAFSFFNPKAGASPGA